MINESFNPLSRLLTNRFPKWSASYQDPNSNTNKLVNPIANAIEYLRNIINDIHQDGAIIRIDTHKHPYKRWVIEPEDVLNYDDSAFEDADEAIGGITSIVGEAGSGQVLIQEVESEELFYDPELQTGWYIDSEIPHGIDMVSGEIRSCDMI